MKRILLILTLLVLFGSVASAENKTKEKQVKVKTNKGSFTIELYPSKAPITVANFLKYAEADAYKGVVFHRIIPGFMAQTGYFYEDLKKHIETHPSIKIESDNGLKNDKYTVAMARTNDPNSASSQFFINFVDNDFLNYRSKTAQGYGYAVFGKVISGQEVIDSFSKVKTTSSGGMQDIPTTPIIIEQTVVVK